MRLFAHTGVANECLHHLHRHHEQRRRDDDDTARMRFLHDVLEMFGKVGVKRFRRHKENGDILRFAGDEITLLDIGDMPTDIGAHPRRRDLSGLGILRIFQSDKGFERLRAEIWRRSPSRDRRRAGESHNPVGSGSIAYIEIRRRSRQRIADDRFHPPLAERAARLLVCENIFQANHFLSEAGQPRLCRVNHRQALVELAEAFIGVTRLIFKAAANPRANRFKLLGNKSGEVRLPASLTSRPCCEHAL